MKHSGIDWLGEIPEDWEVQRLKYLGAARNGLTYSPADMSDEGVLVLRSSNIQGGTLSFNDNVYVDMQIPDDLILQENDLLICTRNGSRALIGKCALIDKETAGNTFGAFMGIFRSQYNRFINYVFQSHLFSFYLGSYLTATVNQLTLSNLNSMEIPITMDLRKQKVIIDYLDKKCGQIDILIETDEKTISELREYKKSIIYMAVTKGIKKASLIDSGIPWLGDIPINWTLYRVKNIFDVQGGNGFPMNEQGKENGDLPFLKNSDINDDDFYIQTGKNYLTFKDVERLKLNIIPSYSIIMGKIGESLKKNHRKVNLCKCLIDNNMQALVIKNNGNIEYLKYLSKSIDMRWFDNGGTIPCVNNQFFLNSWLVIPPLEEQKSIVDYLDKKCGQIDSLMKIKQQKIFELKEYKKSLIYEYVTGKKEVPA